MLTLGASTRVFLAAGATDMRKSFNGLHGLVQEVIQENPLSGHLFAFCNRRRNRLKVLYWDGSGLWVCAKRLERGTFKWPRMRPGQESVELEPQELALIVAGLDLEQVRARPWWRRTPSGRSRQTK